MEPVRDSDQPGAVCYRVTPELYLGHARGQFGNFEGVVRDRPHDYRDMGPHVEGMSYLAGRWRVEQESARSEAAGAAISLRYTAKDVNLVMAPPAGASVRAEITLEGGQRAGDDVKFDGERGFISVDRPRMYSVVANESVVSGAVTIRAEAAGLAVYAFTFISCVVN